MIDNKDNEFFDDQVLDDFSSLDFGGISGTEQPVKQPSKQVEISDEPPIGYSTPIEESDIQEEVKPTKQSKKKEKKQKDKSNKTKSAKTIAESHQDTETVKEKSKFILYILTDKPKKGLLTYIRECGVNVSHVYASIDETRDAIIMQSEPYRLVIIDNGTGKFTNTTTRQQLIDIIGLCDESTRITVFYTDSALKIDSISSLYGKSKKGIDWVKYKNTIEVAAKLLSYTDEQYINDDDIDSEEFPDEYDTMSFKGLASPKKLQEADRLIIQGFDVSALEKELLNEEKESVQKFKVKLKV